MYFWFHIRFFFFDIAFSLTVNNVILFIPNVKLLYFPDIAKQPPLKSLSLPECFSYEKVYYYPQKPLNVRRWQRCHGMSWSARTSVLKSEPTWLPINTTASRQPQGWPFQNSGRWMVAAPALSSAQVVCFHKANASQWQWDFEPPFQKSPDKSTELLYWFSLLCCCSPACALFKFKQESDWQKVHWY